LADVNSVSEADIDRAVERINALRVGDDVQVAHAARVEVGLKPILVEAQRPPQDFLSVLTAVNDVEGVQCHFMSGYLLDADSKQDCPPIP
jgi:hypothetical protein